MPDDALSDGDDLESVARLRLAITRLARIMRQLDPTGLTPTTTALLATIARDGPLTLGQLAASEQVRPSTVTKSVARLEEGGLVERLPDARDRRVCRIALSEDGRLHMESMKVRRTAWIAQRLDRLTPDERARVLSAVDVLEALIEPDVSQV